MAVMGIDLGTTYSCVAIFRNGQPEVVPNDIGKNTTPSVVAFRDGERIVGEFARDYQMVSPQDVVYDAKRLIGRRYDEDEVQTDKEYWPFTVKEGKEKKNGLPLITVKEGDEEKNFSLNKFQL